MSFLNYVPGAVTINGISNANNTESSEFGEAMAKLSPRQARFVKEYLIVGTGAEAARRAGYTAKDANIRAYKLTKLPKVQAALEAGRRDIAKNARYDLQAAMNEFNDAIEYAKSTKNAMAVVKAVEAKAKLNGLMIDRLEVREAPDITGALIEAKRRTVHLPPTDDKAITDVEMTQSARSRFSDPFVD